MMRNGKARAIYNYIRKIITLPDTMSFIKCADGIIAKKQILDAFFGLYNNKLPLYSLINYPLRSEDCLQFTANYVNAQPVNITSHLNEVQLFLGNARVQQGIEGRAYQQQTKMEPVSIKSEQKVTKLVERTCATA